MTDIEATAEGDGRLGVAIHRLALALALTGGGILLFITVLTVVSISGRALSPLGLAPVPGDFEMVEIAAGVAVFFFLPLCQIRSGHVTVDILAGALGQRGLAITTLVGNLLMTAAAAVILWRLVLGALDKLRYGEETFILAIPVWWGYALSCVGAFVFAVTCAYTALRSARALRGGRHAGA